jgi:hypothetical protein
VIRETKRRLAKERRSLDKQIRKRSHVKRNRKDLMKSELLSKNAWRRNCELVPKKKSDLPKQSFSRTDSIDGRRKARHALEMRLEEERRLAAARETLEARLKVEEEAQIAEEKRLAKSRAKFEERIEENRLRNKKPSSVRRKISKTFNPP